MNAWFKRQRQKLSTDPKKAVPDGLWEKCTECEEILFRRELARTMWVCPKCQYHFRLNPKDYLDIIFGTHAYEELNPHLRSGDPLKFRANKKYTDQIKAAMAKTGTSDVLTTVVGPLGNYRVVLGVMDFSFIGGSMGSVVGEKLSRAIDYAIKEEHAVITVSASGGARMQEGIYSLMQMAKTSAKLARFSQSGGLHISLLTDPTTGGVSASYGMLGDVILAEPGALIGFAGPRVIKQTIGEDLPTGFQRAEFLLEKGFVDRIVSRKELRDVLIKIMDFAYA